MVCWQPSLGSETKEVRDKTPQHSKHSLLGEAEEMWFLPEIIRKHHKGDDLVSQDGGPQTDGVELLTLSERRAQPWTTLGRPVKKVSSLRGPGGPGTKQAH